MIEHLEKIITKELADRYKLRGRELSFLKYNTPLSGTGLGNKIIFFVFLENSDRPFLVAKTVRTYRDAGVVGRGYANERFLNNLTKNSPFSAMFPEALLFHDDGYEIWSAETVCGGRRASAHDLENILSAYNSLSEHIKKNSGGAIAINADYGKNILRQFSGTDETIDGLRKYLVGLWRDEKITLPRLPQHGDLTIDNVFIEDGAVRIIDCDLFGDVVLPGFDIFHLLTRSDASISMPVRLVDYFRKINIDVVPDEKLFFIYFLQGMLVKKDYILIGKTAAEIIGTFRDMVRAAL